MTTPVPRRTKDMVALGLDSESEDDLNTPYRPRPATAGEVKQQPMASFQIMARGKENDPHPMPINVLPRRVSELTMIDSSSDEEDIKSNHNLNCAILNDSFVLSPSQELTNSNSNITNRRSPTAVPLKQSDSNLSFLGRFNNMGINCSSQGSPVANSENQVAKKPVLTVQTVMERRPLHETEKRPLHNSETPMRNEISSAKSDADFITPQVRTIGSTLAGKSRSAATNDFRAQKVLFQTPMTVSRAAPVACDSISFSLCDTISESPDIPEPPKKADPPSGHQSKKSLDNAFQESDKDNVPDKVEVAKPKELVSVPAPNVHPVQPSNSSKTSNILKIKNHEYTIAKKLGCGGSSSVYLARRSDSGDEFALKVVDLQADPQVVQGYLNETKLLAKLQGNVCVVALYDYQLVREESKLYMVMEKGDSDLNKILQTYTTNLPLYSLMNILYQMLQAVNYIHQNGVIHSDLKPANFLMVSGRLKLIDFGIASNISLDSTSIIKFSQAGTFNYISPEALTDTSTGNSPMRGANQPKIKISTKSDVWSLGCILYLLLYQKTPFGHIRNIYAKMSAIATPSTSIEFPAIPPYYPIMLVHMAKNCLQLNPKKRPSCTELLQYPFHMIIPIQNLQIPSRAASTSN
ncbi:dual specificity protein kinase TTK [Drosophila eugracilis]|uniref:dual specificity protein kinase TTK n=1 Tax=Drosophila eugracilis TaxID=29029 RepID=UPI001BD96904|nr:dual specificity protein kinase TTK [Drosophila eugracilis]